MDRKLIERADALGINWSMFYMLPAKQREKALLREITAEEKRRAKAAAGGEAPPAATD